MLTRNFSSIIIEYQGHTFDLHGSPYDVFVIFINNCDIISDDNYYHNKFLSFDPNIPTVMNEWIHEMIYTKRIHLNAKYQNVYGTV